MMFDFCSSNFQKHTVICCICIGISLCLYVRFNSYIENDYSVLMQMLNSSKIRNISRKDVQLLQRWNKSLKIWNPQQINYSMENWKSQKSKISNEKLKFFTTTNTSNLENPTKPRKFLVDTDTCKIPNIDPFDLSIRHLLSLGPKVFRCNRKRVITFMDNGTLYINETRNQNRVSYCRYIPIYREQDNTFIFGEESDPFTSSISVQDEYIKVICYNSSDYAKLENFHINFKRKSFKRNISGSTPITSNVTGEYSPTREKKNDAALTRLNVLLIMIDSTSRINSLRYLKQTRQYLTEAMGAIEMLGYNKVADNTFVNMMPFLAGQFADKLPCVNNTKGLDDCPFVWKLFSKQSYITHIGEEWPTAGAFHYNRQGFQQQPVDYYDRPFYLANENGSKSLIGLCFRGKPEHEILFNRIYDFVYNMRNDNYFSLSMFSRYTHNSLSRLIDLDNLTTETLSKLFENDLLNQTFLAVFGDHGLRFGKVRPTFIGQLEERLPMMFIYLPPWFRVKYSHYMYNLRKNSRRLTTHFDMHSTLLHLLDIDNPFQSQLNGRGKSLFQEIPIERSCAAANIPPHWCSCNFHMTSTNNITVRKALASSLVSHLNMLLKKYPNRCRRLSIMSVLSSEKLSDNLHKTIIKTKPGDGLFEATLRYNQTFRRYHVVGDVSRINKYKGTSDCVKDFTLRKICMCK